MGGGSGDQRNKKVIRVVIINTEYVETDATSFKSVVQKLTGKEESTTVAPTASKRMLQGGYGDNYHQGIIKKEDESGSAGGLDFLRNCSLKDLDRLLKEIPTMDDLLYGSWPDNH